MARSSFAPIPNRDTLNKFLTATDARQQIAAGTLSCETLLRQCLAHIDEREADIGAWQMMGREAAIACAQRLDRAPGKALLHGIPLGVKDIIEVAGMPTRNGSNIFINAPNASVDAASVAIARTAGANILGKTVTTELAGFTPGRTRNPQHLGHTPGGSSSGSAAAVADGHVPLALGTQTAGSVIRPAAYCGVFGFKPSFGLMPLDGIKMQSATLDTLGVFARCAEDLALWYAAMTGAKTIPDDPQPYALRINIISNLMVRADAEMGQALANAGAVLAMAGVQIHEIKLPAIFNDAGNDQRTIQLAEMATHYAREHREHRDLLSVQLVNLLDEGAGITEATYRAAMQRCDRLREQADQLFGDCDAWLMPSAIGAAPYGLHATGDPIFNRLATVLHQPAINVPHYRTKAGLPLGLQLVGGRQQDEKLLAVAQQIQIIFQAQKKPF